MAESTDGTVRHRSIVFVAIAIAIVAIFIAVLYSGFSIESIGTANPFASGAPPEIAMIHQGEEYDGQLLGYVWGERTSFNDLPQMSRENVTLISQQNVIEMQEGSEVRFTITGNRPPESPHDSLSVTAFTEAGEPAAVLDASGNPDNNTYSTSSLEEGNQYVLISTATWYPDEREEVVTGYVAYGHRVNVTGPASGG